jgi:hypothetical protein
VSPGVANSHRLPGGKQQTTLVLTIDPRDQEKRNTRLVSLPRTAYDAAVACDIIFSCKWTAENNFMPKPTKHGMYVHEKDECLWIPGMVQTQKQDAGHHCPRRFTPYGRADTTNVTNYNTPRSSNLQPGEKAMDGKRETRKTQLSPETVGPAH